MQEKLESIDRWQGQYSTLITDETIKVFWIPLIELSDKRWIGLSGEGKWVVQGFDEKVAYVPEETFFPLLPCLEISKDQFMSSLALELRAHHVVGRAEDIFPTREVILCGLSSGSDYWASLALIWLEDIEIDDKTNNLLLEILSSNWASQKLKHKIQTILATSR